MGFDVAINNGECNDGNRIVNSVKAAYLYADRVRVYDYCCLQDITEEEFIRKRAKNDSPNEVIRAIVETDYAIDNLSVMESFISAYQRELNNEQYKRKKYLEDLDKMGIDCIDIGRDLTSFYHLSDLVNTVASRFIEDKGFKILNDQKAIDSNKLESFSILAPTALSDYVFSTLPGFEDATIDEIIDIRKELNKYIIPYRSAVLRMAERIKTIPNTDSFQQECAYLYFQEIEPQVASINSAIQDNNVFKNIAKKVITNKETWVSLGALTMAFATTGDIANAVTVGTAVAFGGHSIADGIIKSIEEKKKIKDKEMYFLYESGKKLAELQQKKKDFYMYYD